MLKIEKLKRGIWIWRLKEVWASGDLAFEVEAAEAQYLGWGVKSEKKERKYVILYFRVFIF